MGAISDRLGIAPGLSPVALIGSFVALLAIYAAASALRQYYRLSHIRGPLLAGFSKLWLLQKTLGGKTHLDLYEVCNKYGTIARIAPNIVITTEPELLRRSLNVRTKYQRSEWYYASRFDPTKDNVLSLRDDAAHNKLRAKMAHGYSGKEVENLESKIDRNVRALVRLLETKYAVTGQPFDMGKKVQYFTMDAISDISFGEPIGFLPSDSDKYQYCEAFEKQMPTLIVTTVLPVLVKILQWPLMKKLGPSDRDPLGFGKLLGLAKAVAAQRYAPDAKVQRDMVGSFIAHGLTFEEAESEILLQILAGSDTTATAIRTTLLYIMTNPRVLAALRAEMAEKGVDHSRPGDDASAVISDETSRSMPYLQAIIREGLRIHPPITGIQTKVVPEGGDTYKGVFLPEGTELGHCVWGSMRRAETWGADAAEFRPERWLEADPEQFREMEATLDLVFSHGRWQCLGKNVALMELNKIFVELFSRFDFAIVDPTNPWEDICVGLFIQRNFMVRAYKRE